MFLLYLEKSIVCLFLLIFKSNYIIKLLSQYYYVVAKYGALGKNDIIERVQLKYNKHILNIKNRHPHI